KKKNPSIGYLPFKGDHLAWELLFEENAREKQGKPLVTVPGKAAGLLRMVVDGSRRRDLTNQSAKVWTQQPGRVKTRTVRDLEARVMFVLPARADVKDKLDLGVLPADSSTSATCHCWSATRDDFDLKVALLDEANRPVDHPCFQVTRLKKLDAKECLELQRDL